MLRNLTALLLVSSAAAQISFGPAREITDAISGGLAFATATDMDGDGDPDVMAAESNAIRILWWKNDGAGNFTKQAEWLGDGLYWQVAGLEDWNGDGRADVWMHYDSGPSDASGTVPRSYGVAVNLGGGAFADPEILGEHPSGSSSGDSFVADMNGDSRKDFVTRGEVLLADAEGGFPYPPKVLEPYLWDLRSQATPFDAGNDGDSDLLTLSIYSEYCLMFVKNLGSAGFAEPVALLTSDEDIYYSGHCVVGSGGGHRVLVVEGDGTPTTLRLRSFGIDGDGTLTPQASLPLPLYSAGTAVDWRTPVATKDGRVFLLSHLEASPWVPPVHGLARVHEVTWDGDSLGLVEIASFPGVPGEMLPQMTDLNGDTLPDLLLPLPWYPGVDGSICDQIGWLVGKPGGGLDSTLRKVVAGEGDLQLKTVVDMDGDGDADILAGTSPYRNDSPDSPVVTLWRNSGNGGGFVREEIPHGRDWINIIEVRDVTGPAGTWHVEDPNHGRSWPAGRMDFLAQTIDRLNSKRRYEWFFQDESGGFHRSTAAIEDGRDMLRVALADWDGDGTRDLLVEEFFDPAWMVMNFKKGSGFTFASSVMLSIFPPYFSPLEVPVDMDRDGDLDLFGPYGFFGNQPAYWMENDGSGGIVAIRGFPHAGTMGPDLDGDGHPDLIGQDEILLSRPGLTVESRPFPGIGRIVQVEGGFVDMDGDGDIDVTSGAPTDGLSLYSRIQWWENRGDGHFEPAGGEGSPIASKRWATRDDYQMGDLDGDGVPDLLVGSSSMPRLEWFRVTRKAGTPAFSGWMGAVGLTGHSAGPLGDWDDDGVANWDEFAFGSNPEASDPSHPGRPRLERDDAGMRFTFYRRTDAVTSGLAYPLERATDLVAWEDWTPLLETAPAAGSYEKITVPVSPGVAKEFFRVALPDPH